MVIIKLQCDLGHSFEGWFKNSYEFEQQMNAAMIQCPNCGRSHVMDSASLSDKLESDSFSVVSHQEIRMITEQFTDDFLYSDTDLSEHYPDFTRLETKDFSEDGISSVSVTQESIKKDKLN